MNPVKRVSETYNRFALFILPFFLFILMYKISDRIFGRTVFQSIDVAFLQNVITVSYGAIIGWVIFWLLRLFFRNNPLKTRVLAGYGIRILTIAVTYPFIYPNVRGISGNAALLSNSVISLEFINILFILFVLWIRKRKKLNEGTIDQSI